MIQIRNVPDELHRELRIRAAQAGLSLSDYLKRELERIAARPTLEETFAELASDRVPLTSEEILAAIDEGRQGR